MGITNVDGMLRISRWFGWIGLGGGSRPTLAEPQDRPRDVTVVHYEHADFIFRALQWLGVRPSDLEDVSQEVFIRVHQRLSTYDPSKPIRPWLFGICRKLADHYRKRAHIRREVYGSAMPELSQEVETANPETRLAQMQARVTLEEVLDQLKLIHRAVLVMREIDGMECKEIAEVLGIPEGTVHSRLSNARIEFKKVLTRRSEGGRR